MTERERILELSLREAVEALQEIADESWPASDKKTGPQWAAEMRQMAVSKLDAFYRRHPELKNAKEANKKESDE